MNKRNKTISAAGLMLLLMVAMVSCRGGDDYISLGINDSYYIPRMKKLLLSPAYEGSNYRWTLTLPSGQDTVVATTRNYVFIQSKEGVYNMNLYIDNGKEEYTHSFPITVVHEETEYSPYISNVYEYKPAPGQFINVMPQYEEGDDTEDMRQKVELLLRGRNPATGSTDDGSGLISLGAYGGYVTFGFDHTVMNVPGEKDFYIKGNSFYSDIPEYGQRRGGSCEPGIVMAAFDRNGNGRPDEDEWYELAGSEYHKPTTIKHYSITYHRPDINKKPTPDASGIIPDTSYISWNDNRGVQGHVYKIRQHRQAYYPEWIKEDEMTYSGTLLPPNGEDVSGQRTYYVLYSYPWGYADNHPNDSTNLCSFDLDWAVDNEGRSVHLPGADFIRVYTGVNQVCGWIGETSTEVGGAQDLHILPIENKKLIFKHINK